MTEFNSYTIELDIIRLLKVCTLYKKGIDLYRDSYINVYTGVCVYCHAPALCVILRDYHNVSLAHPEP